MKKSVPASPLGKRLLFQLGDNLKMARLRRKLSLKAVAQRAGVSINTVVAIESGKPGVSIGAVVNILHCLNLAEDLSKVAQDDALGRKLQDLALLPKKRAPKNTRAPKPVNLLKDLK